MIKQPIILMENVSKRYENNALALNDINVSIYKGEFVFIVGPSGSGKSTFMKMLLRETLPSSGKVKINGYNITEMKNKDIHYLKLS